MRALAKALLILEVVVCFGPVSLLLLVGMLMVPMQVDAFLAEPLLWEGPLEVIGLVFCGICGLVALLTLLGQLLRADGKIRRPWLVIAGFILGALPLILDVAASPIWGWQLIATMPLACSAHVLFLSRRMLLPRLAARPSAHVSS